MTRASIFDDLTEIGRRQRELAAKCERCGIESGVSRLPRGCAYQHDGEVGGADDPNYATLCEACFVEERAYWDDMWREYYSSRL